jgi:hypothetical protein
VSGRITITEDSPCGVLFHALERARTLFAIAVAAERRATPPDKSRYYQETEDRMRLVLKDLRSERWLDMTWNQAIDTLRRIPDPYDQPPGQTEAQVLCRQLREVMARLEGAEG